MIGMFFSALMIQGIGRFGLLSIHGAELLLLCMFLPCEVLSAGTQSQGGGGLMLTQGGKEQLQPQWKMSYS